MSGGDSPASSTSPSAVPVAPMPYFPLYINIPFFNGDNLDESQGMEGWISRVKAAYRAWNTPDDQKAEVIIHHLSGEARREILVLHKSVREDAEAIFEAMRDIYGEKETTAALLNKLHSRRQRRGEMIRKFALGLQELAKRVERKTPKHVSDLDDMLCGCFVEGMEPGPVKIATTRFYRRNEKASFNELKDEARRIEEEEEAGSRGEYEQTRASVLAIRENPSSPCGVTSDSVLGKLTEELKALKVVVTQLSQQVNQRNQLPPRDQFQGQRGRPMTRNDNWDDTGRPRCFHCHKYGHMIRDCPSKYTGPSRQPDQSTQAEHLMQFQGN